MLTTRHIRGRGHRRSTLRSAMVLGNTAAVIRRDAGFTLIEILIALLVLSIGMLGRAALQAATVQFNHSAYLRSQATSLAYDIVDRMRANRTSAIAGNYDGEFANPALVCNAAVATPTSVAASDVASWRNALACRLPSGTGSIDVDTDGVATVSIRWDESRTEGQGETAIFAMSTGL